MDAGVVEGASIGTTDATCTRRTADFIGRITFDRVTLEMTISCQEIFAPVLSVVRVSTLTTAIDS